MRACGHCRTIITVITAVLLAFLLVPLVRAQRNEPGWSARSGLLPVPNTANESNDSSRFRPAPKALLLHEYILLPGWVKKPEFGNLTQWLIGEGFMVKQALGPEPWRTYPSIKFSGTVGQFEEVFHITVMETAEGIHGPWSCYTTFTNLLMPARFAPKGEEYIDGFSFGPDGSPGLSSHCLQSRK